MSQTKNSWLKTHWQSVFWPVLLICVCVAAYFTQAQWMPFAENAKAFIGNRQASETANSDEHEHEHEGHDHASHGAAADSITLSLTARKNIGLVTGTVMPSDYVKMVSVPAIVAERPGRSQIEISAPMTGVVTQIYPLPQQAIKPGQKLFDLRLTHEDVVTAQTDFLTRLQALDLANKELDRLQAIGSDIIPGKRIIEQEYKRAEAQTSIAALRQSLLLHGMSQEQVGEIERTRHVLKDITVTAPAFAENHEHFDSEHLYHVQSITVNRGQSVLAGQLLGVLADHCLLYVEGQAFDEDTEKLMEASQNNRLIEVVSVAGNRQQKNPLKLPIQNIADQIDRTSRALKFNLLLENQMVERPDSSNGNFIAWKYRPGQRMEAHIPTTRVMKNKIVLPASAVDIDGPNAFVFEQNGNAFDRVDVHVLYRDKDQVVLENDGKLIGSVIAMTGAYEMQLALKNASGGAIDPHAGHNH